MRDILESYSVNELKKEISKQNIKGYSKMKKSEIINLMMKHKDKFAYLKKKETKKKEEPKKKKEEQKPEPKKEMKKKEEPKPEPKKEMKKKEEPKKEMKKKEQPKTEMKKKEEFNIRKNILDFEEENKSWKQFLKDFKKGKSKFGRKIKPEEYEENKNELKKLLDETRILGNKLVSQDIKNESDYYKNLVKNFINERNKITRLYNKAQRRFNNLSYLLDYEKDK